MTRRPARAIVLGSALLGATLLAMQPGETPPPRSLFCPSVCGAADQAEQRRYIGRLWRKSVDACACEAP